MKPPAFSLRQLVYFVAVAEEGTLSGAALRLHISQSAVSLALGELERALKVQLCVRRKAHGITLTPSGRRLLNQARALLGQAEDLAADTVGGMSGRLLLGCYPTLAPTVLPRLLSGFGERFPQITIDFEERTQDDLQQRMLDGKLDLAVLYDMDVLPEIDRVALHTTRPYVLLPADHRLAGADTVALHDLAEEPMVLLDSPPSAHHTLQLCQEAGVQPLVRHRTSNFETARALVGRGLGYAVLIQRPYNDRTYEGLRVVAKEITELAAHQITVLLAWPRHTSLTQRATAFIEYCTEAPQPEASGLS
ncbi:LysR family transcriptional regulator [Streptomyces sp. NPDC057474]|uniref:LysR family transcriptional regulator n=1 Tax=Streptomyces sp. NPDC057474 TaxID=3346144 RepID=UPI00369D0656